LISQRRKKRKSAGVRRHRQIQMPNARSTKSIRNQTNIAKNRVRNVIVQGHARSRVMKKKGDVTKQIGTRSNRPDHQFEARDRGGVDREVATDVGIEL
jgi:hypothetical protein